MSDFASQDEHGKQAQRRLVLELVRGVRADLDGLSAVALELEAGDIVAWRRAQRVARGVSVKAQGLRLEVLESFARELAELSNLLIGGTASAKPDTLRNAMIALGTVRLELQYLTESLETD